MTIQETQARIKARVWQSLAQSNLQLKTLPQQELEKLVEMVTNAALVELDSEIEHSLEADTDALKTQAGLGTDSDGEEILWEGRPMLSISTRYIITDERLRIIEGVLGKTRVDIELVRIQDINQSQRVGERLLSVGDLTIRSHDRSRPTIVLNNIKDPEQVHEILRRAMLDARKRHGLTYREEM